MKYAPPNLNALLAAALFSTGLLPHGCSANPQANGASNSPETMVKVSFGTGGLTSLAVDGRDRLISGAPVLRRCKSLSGVAMTTTPAAMAFDAAARTLKVSYAWGTLSYGYLPSPSGLKITTAVVNSGTETITQLDITFLSVAALGAGQKVGRPSTGAEGPPVVAAAGEEGSLAYILENESRPLQIGLSPATSGATKLPTLNLQATLGGDALIVDNVLASRPIGPGQSDGFTVSVRLGAAGSSPYILAGDALAAYQVAHPQRLQWNDRRPILRSFFGGGLPLEQAVANLKDPDHVAPAVADPKFRDFVLGRMKSTVEAAKAVNAQGVIIWDLEGTTFPHAITYIGDPRLVPVLNPQMDGVIDAGMTILKDAGLRVGVTLRPSQLVYDAKKNYVRQSYGDAKDPLDELSAKVAYAKNRWGCTLFYVDTNFFWRPYGPKQIWDSAPIGPAVWRALRAKFPDVLFIPEIANYGDYESTATYGEARMGVYETPPLVRAVWPDAWKVLVIDDVDTYRDFDRFVDEVLARNSLMSFCFGASSPGVVALNRIQRQAAMLLAGPPAVVAGAPENQLGPLLAAPDPVTRFFAARRLADAADAASVTPCLPALLSLARDTREDWLVRRAALLALARAPYPAAVPAIIDLVADTNQGLYAAANLALGVQSPAVSSMLLGRIETAVTVPGTATRDLQSLLDALGGLHAASEAPRLEALYQRIPEGPNASPVRRAFIATIGRLRNPASLNFLQAQLANPRFQETAAAALADLGPTGREVVLAASAEATKNGDSQLAVRLNRALQNPDTNP